MERLGIVSGAVLYRSTNINNPLDLTILNESLSFFGGHKVLTIIGVGSESGETADED